MNSKPTLSRRQFLSRTAAAAAAVAAPTIIPATAIGKGGRPAPSERVHLAAFGYGTIAYATNPAFLQDERVQIVAVADPAKDLPQYGYSGEKRGGREIGKQVIEKHYAGQKDSGEYKGCNTYSDFRELFEKEDIDAVNVSTPDHWHAVLTVEAAKRGKHIYGQKPLALTIAEGRAMANAVKEAGVTWQTGSQQRSENYFRMAAELIRNGALGKFDPILVGLPGGRGDWNQMGSRQDPEPVPDGFDYDLWEGPAPHRDYRPALLPLNWRHNFDYSGGMITDWGAHHIDIVQWALGMDESGPISLDNIKGEIPAADEIYNTPTSFNFELTYADGTKVHVADREQNPQGITFKGEGGKSIFVKRGKLEANPRDILRMKPGEDGTTLYVSTNHTRNFIDCVYSGEPTVAPIEAAHRTISIAHLANIALRLGKSSLKWDPAKEQIVGDDEANAMLSRPMRGDWSLEL